MNMTAGGEIDSGGDKPLVSIVVVTFNSVRTVQETLDSILEQNYMPLEVILSDDGSTDGTLDLLVEWRERNAARFSRIEVISSPINRGICKNVAAGYQAAKGVWIKPIAGDDLLLPGAIERYYEVAAKGNHALVVSQTVKFSTVDTLDIAHGEVWPGVERADLIRGRSDRLLNVLRVNNIMPAPAVFLRRADYEAVGGMDERFRHLDDWPLWINLLEVGKTFAWIDAPLVAYRFISSTISATRNATTINADLLKDHATFYQHYQIGYLGVWQRWDRILEVFRFNLARGPLRAWPRLYKFTGVLNFLSPLYFVRGR